MRYTKNKKAFTLVELIVVVTILAILATIGFVSYSSYLVGVRDTNRMSQIVSIHDGMELYRTKKELPLPDDNVEVLVGLDIIAFQGYVGSNILETIDFTKGGVDPKDGTYFTYYLSKNRKYFQLMGFLEENQSSLTFFHQNTFAINYSDRKPIVYGQKLGVLIDQNNTPVQEIDTIKAAGEINIGTTNEVYSGYLEDNYALTGTGAELSLLSGTAEVGGVRNSCKVILSQSSKLKGKDGYYLINQKLPTKVFCDMTTNGGGWTRYINITGNYSFQDAKDCWMRVRNEKNQSETIECFNPNRLSFVVENFMVKFDGDGDGDKDPDEVYFRNFNEQYPSKIQRYETPATPGVPAYRCKGGKEFMTVMTEAPEDYPNESLSNVRWIRLGLSYCSADTIFRQVGGIDEDDDYMNYSNNGEYGPHHSSGNRESNVEATELFIR